MFSKVLSLKQEGSYPRGLSEETIRQLSGDCAEQFGCELPEDYRQFLRKANGFVYDGKSVFCCFDEDVKAKFPRYSGVDLKNFNRRFRDFTGIAEYLILGKSSLDYLCYEKKTGKYQIVTNGTMTLIKESDRLADVLPAFFGLE